MDWAIVGGIAAIVAIIVGIAIVIGQTLGRRDVVLAQKELSTSSVRLDHVTDELSKTMSRLDRVSDGLSTTTTRLDQVSLRLDDVARSWTETRDSLANLGAQYVGVSSEVAQMRRAYDRLDDLNRHLGLLDSRLEGIQAQVSQIQRSPGRAEG